MKRSALSILVLLLALTMILVSCNGGGTSSEKSGEESKTSTSDDASVPTGETGEVDQKIIWAVHNEADTLDPGISNNTFASPVLYNTFEGLVTYDYDNNLINGMAESHEISEDGTTYTFVLKDGLKWSDGTELTAKDFIYAWTRVITPETGSKFSSLILDYVAGAQDYFDGKVAIEDVGFSVADDDKTITIKTVGTTPYFLDILATYTWVPVKQEAVESNPDGWAQKEASFICNGPFKASKIAFGEGVTLVKNDQYYGADEVMLEEINLRLIPDKATALTAFESGQIDGIYDIPSDDIPRLKAESDDFYAISQFAHTYFIFNLGNEPLNDVNVRKALALAIDRTDLIENVLQSGDLPATGMVSPGYMVDGKDYTDGRPDYDITPKANAEKAKELLAEAGYPNGEGFPKLRLAYYSDPNVKKYTEALQQMWKTNLNIDLEITTEEWKVYYDNVQSHDYDIAAMGWGADYLHPMTFLELFTSKNINNNSQYSNLEYDALIDETSKTVDPVKGKELMLKAEQILIGDDMAVCPLYYRSRYIMMGSNVEGWMLSPLNTMYFRFAAEV